MLTPAWTPLKPHEQQSRIWRTKARFLAVCAGRGSGKSEIARRKVVRMLPIRKPWPDPLYFYALPTLGQGKRVAWDKFKLLIPQSWIERMNESTMEIVTVYGSTLRVLGLDVPERAEGVQYDGGVIDESSDQKPGIFDLTFRPALTHRRGWCMRIGVAKRRGLGAREFRKVFEQWGTLHDGVHESYTWPSTDILSAEEVDEARRTMDEKDFNEQILSSWESDAGLVYYTFHETESIKGARGYDPALPIIVGSDFNVDPMAWVLMQQHGDNTIHVFDEIWERNTNTQRTLDKLHHDYGHHNAGWYFFGDASSRARKTSASMSDYVQIRNDTRFKDAVVKYPKANPRVDDRIASVNAMFRNANKQRSLFIHARCSHLIRDLGYLSYDPGSRDINERDPDAKHITDALGYPIHMLRPVRVVNTSESTDGISIMS